MKNEVKQKWKHSGSGRLLIPLNLSMNIQQNIDRSSS